MTMFLQKIISRIVFLLITLALTIDVVYAKNQVIPAEKLSLPFTVSQRAWLEEHDHIYIGAMDDWPPINFINLSGKADGFGVALIKLLNQRLGGRIKLVSGDWPELYQSVVDRQLDAILDITPKASREAFFNFTTPYLIIPHAIIGRDSAPSILSEKELYGKKIALEKGFGNVSYYTKYHPEINIVEYKNTSEALDAVARGDADAYIGNRAVANYIIHSELLTSLRVHARAEKSGSVLAIGTGKDKVELAGILQVALDSISSQELHGILGDVIEKKTALADDTLHLTEEEQKWLKRHPEIRISSNPNWPPLEYYDESGLYQGIAADFLKLIEKKINVKFVHAHLDTWPEVLQSFESKSVDLLPMVMDTPRSRRFALFSAPYVTNSMVIVTQSSVDYLPGLDGLSGKKVAVVNGYASHEIIRSDHLDIQLRPYVNTKKALEAVIRGEAYAFVGNIATTSFIIQQNGFSNLKVSGDTNLAFKLSMGVRDDWPELKSILDKALAAISSQEKAEIYSRWVRVQVSQEEIPWKWIAVSIAILTVIIILISIWNYQLKLKVEERTKLLEYRAEYDELTQISNRASLVAQLERRMRENRRAKDSWFAVLFIDLDDFKKVNDTQGHAIGDKLLVAVASKLKSSIRETDFISRFGGDEFVIITERVHSKEAIETFCSHLLKSIKEPYQLEGLTYNMTMSVGVACYPADGETADDLLRKADTAMYVSKKQGRNHFNFFSASMNEQVTRKLLLEKELLLSLEKNEIFLMYQPIVNLGDGRSNKFEVLARWNSSAFGMIRPDEFISLAEQTGFINQLGDYILEKAIASCASFAKQFDESYSVSVNVSPIQLNEQGFASRVIDLLHAYDIPAESLILEITEGVLINNSEQITSGLIQLAESGVRLAMDDFGTGYSSLSYIRNYPFSILKIDKEFIRDISQDRKAMELVEAVLAISNSLGVGLVAEGVETREQADKLKTIGSMKAQGYYFSPPLTAGNLVKWLSENRQTSACYAVK